ncbi:MAG: hypothetical protein WA484_09210 [Solirubrobacteraceae bacterium]
MRRVALSIALGTVFLGVAGSALGASSVTLCVPSGEGVSIATPVKGSCGAATSVALPSEKTEQEKLISILPHINYEASGIDGKPTIQFTGINLQVIDGSGSESTINGTGNLILGYDPNPGTQTGSHNLLIGGTGNSYSSYGRIVGGGYNNKISGPYASILGGGGNTASGYASTITGGAYNKTTTNYSTVSGGCSNLAGSGTPSVSAFCTDSKHAGDFASILGGMGNQASAENSSVSGGAFNLAGNLYASVSAGKENKATGEGSSVSGGGGGEASGAVSSVTGGRLGKAPYFASTVLGGLEEVTEAEYGVKP